MDTFETIIRDEMTRLGYNDRDARTLRRAIMKQFRTYFTPKIGNYQLFRKGQKFDFLEYVDELKYECTQKNEMYLDMFYRKQQAETELTLWREHQRSFFLYESIYYSLACIVLVHYGYNHFIPCLFFIAKFAQSMVSEPRLIT